VAEPDPPILKALDEMRRAQQVLETAQADFLAKREAMLLLFEETYGAEPVLRAVRGHEPWTADRGRGG
jgi:hypothetical protein